MTSTANQNPPQGAQAIPPRKLPQGEQAKENKEDYDSERRKHLEEHEGSVPRIYTDPAGIPTIGMGHALITKDENGHYTKPR
jgi:hypothetical protein